MSTDSKHIDPNSSEFILTQLHRFGSHLDRTHEMTFWLYFPTEELAKKAANRAEAADLHPEISPPLNNSHRADWLCLLYLPHIPDEKLLDGISRFCEELESEFNGKYDGWESSLELDPEEVPKLPPDNLTLPE